MALGGGTWLFQNKVSPGAYINFKSKDRPLTTFTDRGFAAIPIELDWGAEDDVFSVTNEDFQKRTMAIFGYDYTHDSIKPLRDLFINLKVGHFYRLNGGGVKATSEIGTAKYSGTRGNDLKIVVSANVDTEGAYDVVTYLGTVIVDRQTVTSMADIADNDYIVFNNDWTLAATAGTPLSGGTNGTVTGESHQSFLDKSERFFYNILICPSTEETIKSLYINFTKRMREDVGIKFQMVGYRIYDADYEGVISVFNPVTDANEPVSSAVYWVGGASAGTSVGFSGGTTYISLTNKNYDGEYTIDTSQSNTEAEKQMGLGQFVFHDASKLVSGEFIRFVRVKSDINTFTSFTVEKNDDFSNNQIIRTLDQIAIDIAIIFNEGFLGKVQNDAIGQAQFKSSIIAHHRELERIRALEDFNGDDVIVVKGEKKGAVLVTDPVKPVGVMTHLYMQVIVE